MVIVAVPGSKSVTARALFLAAAAGGESVLRRPLLSDDTDGFAQGLAALGYGVARTEDAWRVTGSPDGPPAPAADVDCRDAGT
ncbi:MAG: 3-phosphoshikimate 1-carboxyvinyltransferase, partial [Streptomyces sp.]|nr:3-phosphoshikimate 1-carboxyvinyltransferase [Streptomyces sp.]